MNSNVQSMDNSRRSPAKTSGIFDKLCDARNDISGDFLSGLTIQRTGDAGSMMRSLPHVLQEAETVSRKIVFLLLSGHVSRRGNFQK
jgi:hypothetical protein